MVYQIIVYNWDEETPSAVIDLRVKENAWFLFHRYLEIGPDGRENISIVELYETDIKNNVSKQLAACQF
jgi:hypothetical protein